MMNYLSSAIKLYFRSYIGIEKDCWQRIFLTFLNDTTAGFCFFLSLYCLEVLHIRIIESSIVLSSYGLGTVIGGVIAGKLSDHINPKVISTYSLLIKSITFFLLIKITMLFPLMLDVFIMGIATYSFKTSNNVWVLTKIMGGEAKKLQALNLLYSASNIGIGIAALIITFVAYFGFHFIFLLSGIILLCASCYLSIQDIDNNIDSHKVNDLVARESDVSGQTQIKKNKLVLWIIMFSIFLVSLIISQLSSTYPIFIHCTFKPMGMKAISLLFILNTLIITLFQTPYVNFFSQQNKLFMSGIGAFLIGFGLYILNISHLYIFAIASCVIFTLGEMLFFSTSQLVCYQCGAENKKGYSMGLFQMIFAMGMVIGPTLGGNIYHECDKTVLWDICGILGFICLLACSLGKKYY